MIWKWVSGTWIGGIPTRFIRGRRAMYISLLSPPPLTRSNERCNNPSGRIFSGPPSNACNGRLATTWLARPHWALAPQETPSESDQTQTSAPISRAPLNYAPCPTQPARGDFLVRYKEDRKQFSLFSWLRCWRAFAGHLGVEKWQHAKEATQYSFAPIDLHCRWLKVPSTKQAT